jgi:hypothetical protein
MEVCGSLSALELKLSNKEAHLARRQLGRHIDIGILSIDDRELGRRLRLVVDLQSGNVQRVRRLDTETQLTSRLVLLCKSSLRSEIELYCSR